MIKFNISTRKEEIIEVAITIKYEPLFYDYLNKLMLYAQYVGFVTKKSKDEHWNLSRYITKYMCIEEGLLKIKPFWVQEYCYTGGVNKQLFFDYERICVESYEFITRKLVECEITTTNENGTCKVIEIRKPKKQYRIKNEDTVKYMKRLKKTYNVGRVGCPVKKEANARGFIYPCCACKDTSIDITTVQS